MSLLARFRTTLRSLFGPEGTAMPQGQEMLAGVLWGRQAPQRGTRELLDAYRRLPFFHAIVRRIAEDVAAVPWQVLAPSSKKRGRGFYRSLRSVPEHLRRNRIISALKDGELQVLEDHPFLKLLDTMNPALGGFDSWFVSQLHLDIIGQAPMLRDNNAVGLPVQLWPVPPHWVAEAPTAGRPRYRVSYGSWYKELEEREMVWLRVPDPGDPYGRGTSYGTAVSDELDVDELRSRYAKNFFYNDATPAAIIQLANAAQPETDRLRDALNDRHRGPGRNGVAFVTNREIKYEQLQQPMRDMQFAEISPLGRNLLLETLQFPRGLLGLRDSATRASIAFDEYLYYRGCVVPRKERQLGGLQPLLDEYDPEEKRLLLSYENPVPDDKEAERDHMVQVPSAFTLNEHREQGGKAPLEGEEGQKLFTRPAPASPFGALQLALGPADPPWVKALPPRGIQQRWKVPVLLPAPGEYKACQHDTEEWNCADNPVVCVECRRALGCHFEPQPLVCMACRRNTKAIIRALSNALEALRAEALSTEVGPVEEEGFLEFAEAALSDLGVNVSFNMRNPLVRQLLQERAGERLQDINDTTRTALREELVAGISAGEGINQLKQRVEDVFDAAEGYRAERIARTEAVGLSNGANLEAWRQSGVVEGKEWLSVRDGSTRDSHRELDGQVVALDAPFTVPSNGRKAQHPGGFGVAEEDIQCRCTGLPRTSEKAGPLTEEAKELRWKAFDKALTSYSQRIQEAFRSGFKAQRKAVLDAL
jgi:SPP1 gp7 family putative phage head morphogenesis protein